MTDGLAAPDRFVVRRWVDPVVESFGFPVNSPYTETVVLPVLGPASVFCLRRLGSWAAASPNGLEVDTQKLARDLGLGDGLGRNSAISRTLNRLCQFEMARWVGGELSVRTVVAPLPERQLRRLSPEMVQVHRWMVDRQLVRSRARMAGPASVVPEVIASFGLGISS